MGHQRFWTMFLDSGHLWEWFGRAHVAVFRHKVVFVRHLAVCRPGDDVAQTGLATFGWYPALKSTTRLSR